MARVHAFQDGFGYAIGFTAATLVTLAAVAAGATHHPGWALLALAGVTGVLGVAAGWSAGLLTAAICWGMDAGFILGREGRLTFDRQSEVAAVVLCAVLVAAASVGTPGRRWARRPGLSRASRRRTIR
jgi:hypothetical protein